MSLSLPAPVHQSHADLETVADFYHEVDRMLDAPLEVPEAFRDDPTIDEETKEHAAVFDKFQNFLALLEECYGEQEDGGECCSGPHGPAADSLLASP